MLVYFDMSKWSWPKILKYMGEDAPAPLLCEGSGWVDIKTGIVEWDTDRNGCALEHFKKSYSAKLLGDGRFFADPITKAKPWLRPKTR